LFTIWVIFHVIVCIALVMVVLLQSSKGEGLAGSAFGGGGGMSGAVFGGRGAASFLSRATTVLAVAFMINCGALAFMKVSDRQVAGASTGSTPTESVVTREAQREREQALEMQQRQQADSTAASSNVLDDLLKGTDTAAVDTSGQ
jgi:preprotein translocase subunit SecG